MDSYSYTNTSPYQPQDIEDASEFYDVIERSNLTHQLSESRPYVYWTMEIYDKANGIKGGGGLGVLAADTRRVAEKLEVPNLSRILSNCSSIFVVVYYIDRSYFKSPYPVSCVF